MAVLFFAGGALALGAAISVILLRNPFYSVLALIVHLVAMAGLFLTLHAEFIAAAQVVVYVGAVMVLYVFVAAYVGNIDEPRLEPLAGQRWLAFLFGAAIFIQVSIAVVGTGLRGIGDRGAVVEPGFGTPSELGTILLEKFMIPFEAASLLLLIATVAAVVLAHRDRELARMRAEPEGTETATAPAGGRG